MPTSPSSYEALAVSYGLAMFAASASWQTQIGAVAVLAADRMLEAKAFIINGLGGIPQQTGAGDDTQKAFNCLGTAFTIARTTSWAVVHGHDYDRQLVGHREYQHSGVVDIIVTVPVSTNEAPNDTYTRALNLMGAIVKEIEDQFGGVGKLLGGTVSCTGPSLADETGARRETFDFLITIHWSDV